MFQVFESAAIFPRNGHFSFQDCRAAGGPSDPLVLVGLSDGWTSVNRNEPTGAGGWVRHYKAAKVHQFDLLALWASLVPAHRAGSVLVMCFDEASAAHVRERYPAFGAVAAPSGGKIFERRVLALRSLLLDGPGRDVLVSDLDALWLQDPVPAAARAARESGFPGAEGAGVVALRGNIRWAEFNCGLMLVRRSWAAAPFKPGSAETNIDRWVRANPGRYDDQQPFNELFSDTTHDWVTSNATGATYSASRGLLVLPTHQFTRQSHLLAEPCEPNRVVTSQTDYKAHVFCVDGDVVVLHNKGECYRVLSDVSGTLYPRLRPGAPLPFPALSRVKGAGRGPGARTEHGRQSKTGKTPTKHAHSADSGSHTGGSSEATGDGRNRVVRVRDEQGDGS